MEALHMVDASVAAEYLLSRSQQVSLVQIQYRHDIDCFCFVESGYCITIITFIIEAEVE